MCHVYRVSSSVRVEQMEAELSRQLSALRVEIQENGAVTSKCYSSVPPPKDISFFRTEREHTLRRGLQVAEALPVQSPADVVQRELESCLSLEYTPDSLPPLLHQFYTDRSYHLAQIKYLLMLRWRRFCRHTSVIEKLYPHYKDQVSNLTSEYEDAVQRARRLSASREKILTGRGNPANLLAQDDVVIYLRWLVCHLHSVQHVHNFLTVLHYIPACERKEKAKESVDGISGPARNVPLHTAHLEEFLPELQDLIAHFHLSYDARGLRSSADEMELFSVVWREFRTMFRHQEQMKTFPRYGGTEVKESQWGRKSASSALKKEADWMPFIQVKPDRDPWQQKLVTKLKEKKCVDELLKMHSRFLQVSDLHDVAVALKEHSATSASHGGEARRHKASEIWTSIYSAASPARETRCGGRGDHDKSLRSQSTTSESYSFVDSLQLLGLDDSLEEGSSDPMVTRGAYLSLMYLRHLKLRQLQRVSLGLLNYLRSVERTLTFDLAGLQLEDRELCRTAEETGWMNAAGGGRGEAGGLGSMQYSHNTPVDCKVRCSEFMEFAEVENLHDFYSSEGRFVHTQDQRGFYIVYDAALKDLEELENELLLVGSHFIQRNRIKKTTAGVRSGSDFDCVALLLDLWTCETEFLESKVQLLNCYYEAYQHAAGTEERCALARVITDIMHSRPQLDLNQDYFVQVYRAEIGCLRSHQQLIKNILDNQIEKQRQYLQRIWRDDRKNSVHDYGLPPNYVPKHLVSLGGSSPALMNIFLLEVHPSLCLASAVYHGLVQAHSELCQLHRAVSITDKLTLRQKLLQEALQSWSDLASPGVSYSAQIQKDLFSDFFFEDPILVQKVGLRFISSAEERDVTQGREKQSYAVETFSRLLELVTIRHRLLGSASETAHLAQLYRHVASELGFDDFHLHLRPVQFEVAEQKDKAEPRPVFITATLEDDSCVDRFTPSHLPLSIQELDENQIGRFSFSSEEAVIHLMNKQSVENLQVTLACQVTQKNALMNALKLVCLCRRAESVMSSAEIEAAYHSDKEVSKRGRDTNSLQEKSDSPPSARTPTTTKERLMEAFVSIQLEKVGLRDEMLNSFRKKKQAAGGLIKTPAAAVCRGMMLEISALQAQVAHLEQEKSFLEERLSLKFKERYDPLVRHLVSTCIQLKARLDEHSRQMEQDVSEMVNRTRGEGVDRIIKLKKKYGCTKDNDGLTLRRLKKEEVHELQQENSRLAALLCKLRAVSSWRRLLDQEKLHRQLLQTQQREINCRAEALRVKMKSEEEVVLLQEELDVVRKVLTRCQAECSSTKKLLSRKTEELQVSRHQSAQEACSRQELDSYRVQSLEQMRADVEDRERQVRALSEQLDRGSRVNQLHRQRSAKEIRQVKGKLQQALSLKQEAFQRVDELQDQVNDMEAAFSRCTSMTGQSRTYYTLSLSRLSTRSPSAGPHRTGQQQQQQLQLGSLTNHATLQDSATQPRHQRAETARSRPDTRIDRPRADAARLRVLTAETTFPDL